MLLPHSWEEGCEIFLTLARNQSWAHLWDRLVCKAEPVPRAGLGSLGLCEELGVQVGRTFPHLFPSFYFRIEMGWKIGQRNSCDMKCQSNFSFESCHSISSWIPILLWTLDVKGASKCGSRTYWSIFSFQNGIFPISTLSHEVFHSDRSALPNAKAFLQKVLLSRKFPGSSAFHVMLHEFCATPCCSALS